MTRCLVNERNWAESTEQLRFHPSRVEVCSVNSPQAGHVFHWAIMQPIVRDDPWHYIDQLCIHALVSGCTFAAATCCARLSACSHRSLNILTVLEPMGLSSRSWLLLLASYHMVLTRERKNLSRIAREMEICSTFAWSVPTLVLKNNKRFPGFEIFRRTVYWSIW